MGKWARCAGRLLPHGHADSSTSPALRAKTLLKDHPVASRRWTPQCFIQVTHCFVAIPGCSCSEVRQCKATGWDVAPGESCCSLTVADGTRGILNIAYSTHTPNTWKCHIASPNFCPPTSAQFPSKDKAVCYFWLPTPAQGTLIFPCALRAQTLPVTASEQRQNKHIPNGWQST